ncbi:MAG: hypothetical protein ACE5HN_05575 [Nitrospiria bacterium]
MKGIFRFITVCLICFMALPAAAQEPGNGVPGIPYGNAETFAEFHGFINLDYRDFGRDAPDVKEGEGKTFDQTDFYFNAIAKIRENVTAFGEVEYKHGGEKVFVDRAFINWRIRGDLTLDFGKMYAPFGLEILEYQAPVRRLASRPFMVDDLLYDEWTEVGFRISQDFPDLRFPISYHLALVNGPAGFREDDRQNRDNNGKPIFIGRITAKPHETVTLGVSYAGGKYDQARTKDIHLVGLEANLRWDGLDLRGEYVRRSGDDQVVVEKTVLPGATISDPPTTSIQTTVIPSDASGYYIQVSYRFFLELPNLNYIEPVVRHDARDPDRDIDDNNDRSRWAIGLNASPYPHFLFKIEYDFISERHGGSLKNNAVLAEVVVDF